MITHIPVRSRTIFVTNLTSTPTFYIFILIFKIVGCGELQQVINQLPQTTSGIGNVEIASGLREALNIGIDKQVTKLTQQDGFFKNDIHSF